MGVAAHDAEVQRHRQRHAAADAKTLDGADGDLLHFLPGAGEPRSQFQMPAQRADIHGPARAAVGVLQVEACAERIGAAGEHYRRGSAVVFKTAGGVGELPQRFRRQRVDAVATVEAHHGDAPLGTETPFDGYEPRQRLRSLPAIFLQRYLTNAVYHWSGRKISATSYIPGSNFAILSAFSSAGAGPEF